MAQVVQAACPGCKQVLRIPAEWIAQPMKCKHCGLIFQARPRAIPVARAVSAAKPQPAPPVPKPVVNLTRTPLPPARKVTPGVPVAAPVAVPVQAPPSGGTPFSQLDFDASSGGGTVRRRRRRGSWWKGAVLAFCILGVAVGVTAVAFPYISQLANSLPEVTKAVEKREHPKTPVEPAVRPVVDSAPKRPVGSPKEEAPRPPSSERARPKLADTAPEKPVVAVKPPKNPEPPVSPPSNPPPATGKFPRRALLISVINYLYFNPVNYGSFSPSPTADVHSLVSQLNKGLDIPVDLVTELSDATPDPAGKRGKGARVGAVAPTKSVIEQTVTDFLGTSRAQDRILLLFIGHAVEMDGEVFLVPIEAERDHKESLVPLKWLYEKLAACPARQKVLVMDTCRFDPSRGFERPGSGSADAKVEGAMTAKIDEALKYPPACVQLWSACVVEQHSLELENNGVFIDALWHEAAQGIPGVIQRRDGPMPIERLVDRVNQRIAARLGPYNKKQTSRLVGKEPEEGAAYNPAEPVPPRVAPKQPAALAEAYSVDELRKLLEEVDLPPIKIAKDETPLRAEALPPFPAKAMAAYQAPDDKEDTPLRAAVKAGVKALGLIREKRLQDEWPDPPDENKQKLVITDYQRKELSGVQRELTEARDDLEKAGTPEARAKESRRWLAHYDLVLARLDEELAYLNEYQGKLGEMKKQLPDIDRKVQNGWRVASQPNLSDSQAKKDAGKAKKILEKIAKDYPNTPWEVLAKRDKLTALGMEWQAAKLGQQ
jgi:hypothetical protein